MRAGRKLAALTQPIRMLPSQINVAPTLFDEWALIAEWGRIGQSGMVQTSTFADEASASAARTKRIAIKQRRGYQSKGTEGNCPGP